MIQLNTCNSLLHSLVTTCYYRTSRETKLFCDGGNDVSRTVQAERRTISSSKRKLAPGSL